MADDEDIFIAEIPDQDEILVFYVGDQKPKVGRYEIGFKTPLGVDDEMEFTVKVVAPKSRQSELGEIFARRDPIVKEWEKHRHEAREEAEKQSDELLGETRSILNNMIWDIGSPVFQPLVTGRSAPGRPLQDFLNPKKRYDYELLISEQGNLELVERDLPKRNWKRIVRSEEPYGALIFLNTLGMKYLNASETQIYHAKDMTFQESLCEKKVVKVEVNRKVRCCKLAGPESKWAMQRKFDSLLEISKNGPPDLKVPRLVGVVQSVDMNGDREIIGIIEEYITCTDPRFTIQRPSLGNIDLDAVPERERNRWARQVRDTVEELNTMGIILETLEPENILIGGKHTDAWLINFISSIPDGRKSIDDLMETPEDNMYAIEKIEALLSLER